VRIMALARSPARGSIFALSGMLVWAAHFTIIYGLTSLACARGFAETEFLGVAVIRLGIGTATLIAGLAALAVIGQALRHRRARQVGDDSLPAFAAVMAILIAGLALVAILWEALPVLMLPPCA